MHEDLSRSSRVALAPHARFRAVCDEGVVLNQTAGEVLVVSPVGRRVLELIGEDGAVASVIARLHKEFAVDRTSLERDVLAFLGELMAAGTVQHAALVDLP